MNIIYACIFHQESYIQLLKLLVQSIEIKGNFDKSTTDILIMTSPEFQPIIKKELTNFDLPFDYYLMNLQTLFEAGCARLNIFKYDKINKYDNILYLDTDILINSDVNVLFNLNLSSEKLYAVEEGIIGDNWHGSQLFDFNKYDKNLTAFTSGILLFKNNESIKSLFISIQSHIDTYIKINKIHINNCLEQPFIIYNAITQNKYDNQLLKKYIENNPTTISSEKIVYHFPGTAGAYNSKQSKMIFFWDKMNDNKQQLPNKYIDVKTQPDKNNRFNLVGICVSYNYFDTLKFMLPVNYLHFEKIYLITQEDDKETIEFCKKFDNVIVLFYNFKTDNKKFDKYGGLNYALKKVYSEQPDSWYLIIDSDILLPNNFIDILIEENLNSECIYGAIRHNILKSSELMNKSEIIKVSEWYNNIRHLKDFLPPSILGCFQLFKKKNIYHTDCQDAGWGDYAFGHQNFDLFCNLETMFVLHMGPTGVNWSGKVEAFIDDCNISLDNIYYECTIIKNNCYYNKKCELVRYGDSKNIDYDIWTCSDKMRFEIANFFEDKPTFNIAEIGAHKGYTTRILSSIFSKVYAVDNSEEWTEFNKNYNKDKINIEYVFLDIYKDSWEKIPNDVHVSFIDAVHSYEACKNDILNSIKRFTNLKYIIFDDYGVWPGVKKVVDEMIANNTLFFEKFIGLTEIPGPSGIVKNSNEGIICGIRYNKNILDNTKFSWNNSSITFLQDGKMSAFGSGTYSQLDTYTFQANFGGRKHKLVFNSFYNYFTSTREGDNVIVSGDLIN